MHDETICYLCDKQFKDKSEFESHVSDVHARIINQEDKCELCSYLSCGGYHADLKHNRGKLHARFQLVNLLLNAVKSRALKLHESAIFDDLSCAALIQTYLHACPIPVYLLTLSVCSSLFVASWRLASAVNSDFKSMQRGEPLTHPLFIPSYDPLAAHRSPQL